jgi:hypothetical protein
MAATAHLNLVAPDNEKCTVQSAPARLPRRKPCCATLAASSWLTTASIPGPRYSALGDGGSSHSKPTALPARSTPSAAPLPEARRIFQENLDECSMGPFLR